MKLQELYPYKFLIFIKCVMEKEKLVVGFIGIINNIIINFRQNNDYTYRRWAWSYI